MERARRMHNAIVVLTASLLLVGQSSAQTPGEPNEMNVELPLLSVTLPPPLARVLSDYELAWRSKDAAALAALFAEDGFVLSSGVPPVRGRLQIQRQYAGKGGPLALRALAFAAEGSVAYIIGGFARQRGECVFRTKPITHSGGRRSVIPEQGDHSFRAS